MVYTIVNAPTARDLTRLVRDLIQQGYVPQGGVTVDTDQGRTEFYQAMVKVM